MKSYSDNLFIITFGGILASILIIGLVADGPKNGQEAEISNSQQLQYLQAEEKIEDINFQLSEQEIETDDLILADLVQEHLRGLKHSHNPVICLTNNIYYEAGTEPYEGQVAVAQVTMNRVADNFGGDTVCKVVYFKKFDSRNGKIEAAFSWTLGKKWRARGGIDRAVWRKCEQIAQAVLAGKLHSTIIGNDVEYYHAVYIRPSWVDEHHFVAQIGNQDFYE